MSLIRFFALTKICSGELSVDELCRLRGESVNEFASYVDDEEEVPLPETSEMVRFKYAAIIF